MKKKLKKFFTVLFFWLPVNMAALVVCEKFFFEDFYKDVPHNMWISVVIFLIGVAIIKVAPKILIENLFEKLKKPNLLLKRNLIILINLILNIIASILIICAIASAFRIPADIFFAKVMVGVIFIFNILKLKKVLERMRKNRPVKKLLPYG